MANSRETEEESLLRKQLEWYRDEAEHLAKTNQELALGYILFGTVTLVFIVLAVLAQGGTL